MSVSVVTTVISLFTLATATAAFGVTAWIANVIATTVATIPSYYLNRRWTWGRTGASDPWREVLPFWALAFAGLALSTISVALTDAWSVGAHLAPPVHTMTLLVAHLSGFGVLWVAQFILLDRILFGRDAHSTTHSPPPRGHGGHTDPFPRGNSLPANGSPQAPQAREIASDEQGSNFEPPWGL